MNDFRQNILKFFWYLSALIPFHSGLTGIGLTSSLAEKYPNGDAWLDCAICAGWTDSASVLFDNVQENRILKKVFENMEDPVKGILIGLEIFLRPHTFYSRVWQGTVALRPFFRNNDKRVVSYD